MRATRLALLLLAALVLSSCGPTPQMGGAGAEAGNAITVSVLSPSGVPVAGASVEIRPMDSDDSVPTYSVATGPDGSARFEPGTAGPWSILVRKEGMAFWQISQDNENVVDTLRTMGSLAGFLKRAPGSTLSIPGLGYRTNCNADGFFSLESLPSGFIPIRHSPQSWTQSLARQFTTPFPGEGVFPSSGTYVRLEPGRTTILSTGDTVLPNYGVVADDFIPWLNRPLPATFPAGRIPSVGNFYFGALLRLDTLLDSMELMNWRGPDNKRIRFGIRRNGSLFADINGDTLPDDEIRCASGRRSGSANSDIQPGKETVIEFKTDLGASSGTINFIKDDTACVYLLASEFEDRSGWEPPTFGSLGAVKVIWIANLQAPGQPTLGWLSLSRMWSSGY
ncbi:MAG: hypothetical protein RL173_1457 [Fibrobacterota bacterium]